MILLDTHTFVWLIAGDANLGAQASTTCRHAKQGELLISAISFWEMEMLAQRGRVSLDVPVDALRADAISAGIREIPIDGDIGIQSCRLQNMHRDPADRMILASAIIHDASVLTADRAMLAWMAQSGRCHGLDARQ